MSEFSWWTLLKEHWGKVLGGLLGLIFALLVINVGFWWSVFIYICVGAGLLIGWRLEVNKNIGRYVTRFFSPNEDS